MTLSIEQARTLLAQTPASNPEQLKAALLEFVDAFIDLLDDADLAHDKPEDTTD